VRRIRRYLPLLVLLLASIQLAGAQSLIDINMGFGAAQDKATGNGVEGDYSGANYANFGAACVPGLASDPTCAMTRALGGGGSPIGAFFMGFGANLMLWEHFGVGMEYTVEPGKGTYALIPGETSLGTVLQSPYTFQTRMSFYDFNGIYQPVKTRKADLQLIGGFGGASVKSYTNQAGSSSLLGSSSSTSQLYGSSNHLNLHAGVAVQIYVDDHFYIRPQFDIHYVPNLAQFGSKIVTQEMVWVGYTIGDRIVGQAIVPGRLSSLGQAATGPRYCAARTLSPAKSSTAAGGL
jgi:hypothetical protein